MSRHASDVAVDYPARNPFELPALIGAIAAVLLGLFGLIFPTAALTVLGLLVGVYLIVSGILRVSTAVSSPEFGMPTRWGLGILGVLIVAAGVVALNNPGGTLVVLVIVVGIGWMIDGIGYLVAAFTMRRVSTGAAVALAIGGVLLFAAGVILLVVPQGALTGLFTFISVLMLVFGAASLVALLVVRLAKR